MDSVVSAEPNTDAPNRNRQRLAWMVLLLCFASCALITVSIPAGISFYRQRATLPMAMIASPGTRFMINNREPLSERREIDLPTSIETNSPFDRGLLEFFDPSQENVRALMTLSGSSVVAVDTAKQPRYVASSADSTIDLKLVRGRINIRSLEQGDQPPVAVSVRTDYGTITTRGDGDVTLEIDESGVQVSVFNGTAQLASDGGVMTLATGERGKIAADAVLSGPFGTARNLIRNGNFSQGLDSWYLLDWRVEPDQPMGETTIADMQGEPVLRFRREGAGPATNEIRQVIDASVIDYTDLRLNMSLIIWSQSLLVCGNSGTECPLTIRIDYEDQAGGVSVWEQGIYALGDPAQDNLPPFCIGCEAPLSRIFHWQAQRVEELVSYESENLIEQLAVQESFRTPVTIKAISIIADGHAFEVDVVDIKLIANE